MKDEAKTKKQLIDELNGLRRQAAIADKAEAEFDLLKDRQEKFAKAFLQNATPMIISSRQEGRFIDVNEAFLTMVGLQREDVIGKTSINVGSITREDRSAFLREFKEKGRVDNLEISIFAKSGETKSVLLNSSKISLGDEDYLLTVVTDISARKKAEEALRHSESLYKAIFENTGTATVVIETDKTISLANTEFEKLTGYSKAEIEGKMTWTKFNAPEDLEWMQEQHRMRRADPASAKKSYEFRIVDKAGARKNIHLTVDMIPGTAKSIASLLDVTDRKRATEALRESKELHARLVDTIPDIVLRMDLDGRIVFVNDYALRIGGYSRAEIEGQNILAFVCPEDRDRLKRNMAHMMAGRLGPQEYRIVFKDGKNVPFEANGDVLRGADGTPSGLVFICRDITGRKQAEEALYESEERYRRLFEDAMEGIFRTTLDGRPLMVNDAMAGILGYDSAQHVSETISDVGSQTYAIPLERHQLLDALMQVDKITKKEFLFIKRDGSTIKVLLNVRMVRDENGEPLYIEGSCIDITDKWLAEEALKASEKKYRKIFENATEGIYQTTPDGRYLSINPAFAKMFGYSSPQEMMDAVTDIRRQLYVNPADREELLRILRERGRADGFEIEGYRKDGSRFWISINIHAVYDDSGNILYFEGTNSDVTQRRQAEEALRESERKFRDLAEKSMVGIYLVQDGRYRYVNAEFANTFGYAIDEIVNKLHVRDMIHPDDLPMVEDRLNRRISGELQSLRYEFRIRTKDGKIRTAEVHSSRTSYQGKPAVIGTMLDITERRKAEEESRRLSIAIEQAAEDIIITDPEGIIQYANPAFEKITGYSRVEAIGATPRILKSGVHEPAFYKDLWETIKNGNIWTGRFINRCKDGRLIYEDATISPLLTSSGKLLGYVALKRDVTESVRMELHLREAQKMEAIGNLAGGIAHDFNNILSVILGYTELYRDRVQDRLEVYNSMGEILKAASRARDLVQQILTFSRRTTPEKRPTMLIPIVKEMAKFLRASLPSTIDIRLAVDKTPDVIMADATQIHQVLMNLCTNAGHAMRETGGILDIGLRETFLDEEDIGYHSSLKPGRYLELFVRDTGHGISRDNLERIFEPYFTTKEKGEGTGLGLAVVHGIVRDHGGEIKVYSEERKGTAFSVYLPAVAEAGEKEKETEKVIHKGNGEKILFVDDEKMIVELSREVLEKLGYAVVAETDPVRAIELFREGRDTFDLVITDKTMPHMTGFDLTKAVKEIRADIPVLLCSGFQEKEDPARLAALGIGRMIMKPAPMKILARAVRELLDGKTSRVDGD